MQCHKHSTGTRDRKWQGTGPPKRSIKPIFDLSPPKHRGEGTFIRFLQTDSCFHYQANLFVPYLANSTASNSIPCGTGLLQTGLVNSWRCSPLPAS